MNSSERFRAGEVYASDDARRAGAAGGRALYGATLRRPRARARLAAAGSPKDCPPPDSLPAACAGPRGRRALTRPRHGTGVADTTDTFRAAVRDAREPSRR